MVPQRPLHMVGPAKADSKAADAEVALQRHYSRLYAQLSMQAQHKYFSSKSLSGKGAAHELLHCSTSGSCAEAAQLYILVFIFRRDLITVIALACR